MKCQSFPFAMIFATVSLCTVLLFLPASIGSAAESGLDTAKIESITGLKGVLNERRIALRSANPGVMLLLTLIRRGLPPLWGSLHGRPLPQDRRIV